MTKKRHIRESEMRALPLSEIRERFPEIWEIHQNLMMAGYKVELIIRDDGQGHIITRMNWSPPIFFDFGARAKKLQALGFDVALREDGLSAEKEDAPEAGEDAG